MPEAPLRPVLLCASDDSSVNGTRLKFYADSTFRYENLRFGPTEVVIGRYTRIDRLIRLDHLPKTGMLKPKTLLVRPSPNTKTGQGIGQVGPTGRVYSTLVVCTIYPHVFDRSFLHLPTLSPISQQSITPSAVASVPENRHFSKVCPGTLIMYLDEK